MNIKPVMSKPSFLKGLYNKIKIINGTFNSSSCRMIWFSIMSHKGKKNLGREVDTNIDIDNSWFVLVTEEFRFKIYAINLSRGQGVDLFTFHPVHSCCFKYRIMCVTRCIQDSIRKHFPPVEFTCKILQ